MKTNITFGNLFQYMEEFLDTKFESNIEVDVSHLGVRVPTPDGDALVHWVIRKDALPTLKFTFDNGTVLECATKHILVDDMGLDVYADTRREGDLITSRDGLLEIKSVEDVGEQDCYDIGIPAPHHYYDANGILHHNTIICGALSKLCEQYGRTLIIVPSKSLVTQTEEDYRNLGLDVGVYYGDRKELGKTHTISTWQSLSSLCKKDTSIEEGFTIEDMIEGVVTVIVDECFDGDTQVLTVNGYKPIRTIEPGDQVINYCETSKTFKVDNVVKRHENLSISSSELMYELLMDDGQILKVTGNHKFLTDSGWKRADELTSEDEIISHAMDIK